MAPETAARGAIEFDQALPTGEVLEALVAPPMAWDNAERLTVRHAQQLIGVYGDLQERRLAGAMFDLALVQRGEQRAQTIADAARLADDTAERCRRRWESA